MRAKLAVGALLLGGIVFGQNAQKAEPNASAPVNGPVKDPVCGMTMQPKEVAARSTYNGKTYYFCSKDDKQEFDKSPDKYAKDSKPGK